MFEKLSAYRARYAPVAARAGMADEFGGTPEVMERYAGSSSTDYWGHCARAVGNLMDHAWELEDRDLSVDAA